MKVSTVENMRRAEAVEFDSLHEFYDYICKTPFNNAFRFSNHQSVSASEKFTKTKSFDEASELFKKGWSDMAGKLVQRLKVEETKSEPTMKAKNTLGVCGYQAIVPLYLQGVPNNMVSKKMVPVKQKVITLNKSIDYNAGVKADEIIEESVKAMMIVKKLEAQGYRCNLNIVLGTSAGFGEYRKSFFIKVRIKSANEKLNVSKLAFPLVHPSMLRRLFLRFIEVYPNVTKVFTWGYGTPSKAVDLRKVFKDGYLLPAFVKKDIKNISSLQDLENV